MNLHQKTEMIRAIDALAGNGRLSGKKVFAFGYCNATEEMTAYLLECGIAVTAILDNNENKQGGVYCGIRIVPPEYILEFADREAIVLIATRFYEQMSIQLRGFGYIGDIAKVVDFNTFAEYSLSDDIIQSKTERMIRGTDSLKMVRQRYPEHYLVICPFQALGDAYWALAYLPAYCEKYCIKHITAVVSGNGCRQVAEMFGVTDIVTLDQTQMDEFVQAVIVTREKNCIIAHHDRPYTDNIIKYLNHQFLSFPDYYKYAVYGLNQNAKPAPPVNLDEFEEKALIARGKTAIIAPYANSVVQPPAEFWDKIVIDYQRQGFHVFTNIFGNEKKLAGTESITIPPKSLVSAVEYAGHFIGLRSGLCDIVSTANCRKTVVFPDCIYSTTPHKVADFFAMPGWEQIFW